MSDIKISVETAPVTGVEDEVTVIRVDGVIDTMTASELEKVTNTLLDQNKFKIVVDLGGVDYISSAGWGIFISNIREIRLNEGDIKLARMIPNVYEIFELLEFDSILKAFDNVVKAKNDFAMPGAAPPIDTIVEKPEPAVTPSRTTEPTESGAKPSIVVGGEVTTQAPKPESEPQMAPPLRETRPATDRVATGDAAPNGTRTFAQALTDLVGKDPFLSVGEIAKTLKKDFPSVGYLKVWWRLRKLGLGSKKKRFYFARTRRFSK